jgi:D-sedoheptulose 7-phosphate isomerase
MKNYITKRILSSIEVKRGILTNCVNEIQLAVNNCVEALNSGNKILWCGNGGSAADAQHMSAELMGEMKDHSRDPFPSIALSTDTSFITAWANDIGYESIFSRQIKGLGNKNDILIAISTSGNSMNIINGIKEAKIRGIKSIGLTNENGGMMKGLCDIIICIPSIDTQIVQEGHLVVEHILCECIENKLN